MKHALIKQPKRPLFKGQRAKRNGLNKTEEQYAEQLAIRQHAGEIQWYRWEGIKLRVTDPTVAKSLQTTWYTPDFLVMAADGTLECHEIKGGFAVEKDILRLKAAASHFPFQFVLARKLPKSQGGWQVEVL